MKIVIDIPEREFSLYSSMVKMDMGNEAVRFIVKGKPLSEILDKISAEIKEEYDPTTEGRSVDDTYDSFHWGLRFCLEIIDKYKGVSE